MQLTDKDFVAGAIAFINKKTGQDFNEETLPADLKIAVNILVNGAKQNPAIASQRLGDMSKSFFDSSAHEKAAMKYIRPYMRVKFI